MESLNSFDISQLGLAQGERSGAMTSVQISQLGLTVEEISTARRSIKALVSQTPTSESQMAARASSQGILMINRSSLWRRRHFDRTMQGIQERLEHLVEQSTIATVQVYDQEGNLIDNADAQIAKYHEIMRQIDELEADFNCIAHIRDIVRDLRQRAEDLERELQHPRRQPFTPSTHTAMRGPGAFIEVGGSASPRNPSSAHPRAALSVSATRRNSRRTVPANATLVSSHCPRGEALEDEISSIFDNTEFFQEDSRELFEDECSGTDNELATPETCDSGDSNICQSHASNESGRSSNEAGSPSTGSDRSWMTTRKEQVVDKVMEWLVRWLDRRIETYNRQNGQPSDQDGHTVNSSEPSRSFSAPGRGGASGSKRPQHQRGSGRGGASDGGNDDEPARKQWKKPRLDDATTLKMLACPFFKRNPRKHQLSRACPGPGWNTVHRVKEHLYRRHSLPKFKCYRCRNLFPDEATLSEHSNADERCEPGQDTLHDGLTDSQIQKLRSRKRTVPQGQTQSEEEKWIAMYQIIFPDDADIPSPYYDYRTVEMASVDSVTVEQYGSYLRRELPPLIRRELEALMEGEIEERLQLKVIQTIQALQSQLHQGFRETYLASKVQQPEISSSKAAGKLPDVVGGLITLQPQNQPTDATLFQMDNFLLGASVDIGSSSSPEIGMDSGYDKLDPINWGDDFPGVSYEWDDCGQGGYGSSGGGD